MTTLIENLLTPAGSEAYYDSAIRAVLEDHMSFFLEHPKTSVIPVEAMVLHQNEFDLISLFNTLKIPMAYHWFVMRLNGITSFTNVPQHITGVIVTDFTLVENIIKVYRAKNKIK